MSGSLEEITTIQTSLLATQLHHPDGLAAYHQVVEELNCYRNMSRIAQNLRQALHPTEVLKQAVETVRQLLSVDGAVLYRFQTEEEAIAAIEATSHDSVSILFDPVDPVTARRLTEIFQQLSLFIIDSSIGDNHLADCPVEIRCLMQQHQAKAALITVIRWEGDLIGIICAYQTNHARQWKTFEAEALQQLSTEVAIAICQARLYQASQVQVQELEKLNRLKDEFLSTVSHELRTPIANVKMAIKMLRLAPTEEKRNQYLDILNEQSLRKAKLINDLLEFQRLEGSSCPIALQPLSLHPIALQPLQLRAWILELVEPFKAQFINREQTFSLDLSENLPTLFSDANILCRILVELLNNACKYTAPGGRICLSVTYEAIDRPVIIFQVGNRAHIPKEELTKVFDKFYRCPHADPWSKGGTGLGLALVETLVKQLQAAIVVKSKNDWTTFTVKHPMRIE